MRFRVRARRSRSAAFTLLEIVLAMAIALVLMGGLFVAMTSQLRHAQAGRTVVEQGTFVRGLLARITADVSSNLGPVSASAPQSASGSQGGSSGTGGAGASNAGAAAGNAATNQGASNTTPATGSTSPTGATNSGTGSSGVTFNLGVQGDSSRLILYASRFPRELPLGPAAADQDQTIPTGVSDLRRISYWLASGSGGPAGLARQELKHVTSDDLQTVPPDVPDEGSCVIAEEVKAITFSYFDGTSWQDSWDGTTLGPDGVTPIGPPAAIGIVLEIQFPGSHQVKKYRHVVAIPTANGPGTPAATSSTNNSSSSTGGGTGP
jgi:hypothetical protein